MAISGALSAFAQAPAEQPPAEEVAAIFRRGTLRLSTGDAAGAKAEFDRVIAADPRHADAYLNRGGVFLSQGDFGMAAADFVQHLRLKPDSADGYMRMGEIGIATQDFAGAVEVLGKAIELKPDFAMAYFRRGMARVATADYPGAVADEDRAIALLPNPSEAHYVRGIAHGHLDNLAGSIADLDSALRLQPRFAPALYERAKVRQQQADFAGAVADYDAFIRLTDPRAGLYPYALIYRHLCLRRLARLEPPPVLATTAAGWADGWPKRFARYLTGAGSEAELLAAAAQGDEKQVAEQTCEANYFVGVLRLIAGDTAGARLAFEKSVATNQKTYVEYDLARAELGRLRPR